MGCKRLIFDSGYLEAMHRPNLKMNFDGIESIVEDGIVGKKDGEHIPFDVMIFATGYAAVSFIHHVLTIRMNLSACGRSALI